MQTKKEWAEFYTSTGWKVFPCHSMRNGACSCGNPTCERAAKHPRTRNGFKDASGDIEQVCKWWSDTPDANIGLATGEESGVWVLDIDGPEGCAALAKLEAQHGKLPPTVTSKTSKGEHLFFQWDEAHPVGSRARQVESLPEIDTRGNGGYVIVPPSNHRAGVDYLWVRAPEEGNIAPAPEWLLELVSRPKRAAGRQTNVDDMFNDLAPDLDIRTAPGAPEGQRHSRACALIGSALGRNVPIHRLTAFALAWGQRCTPPMDEDELFQIIEGLSKKDAEKLDQPISNQPPAWPTYREGAFYGLAGEIVRTIRPETESDPLAILVQLLVFFGNAIGRQPHFLVESTKHHCNLFAVIVGDTAKGRKGTSADRVRELFRGSTPLFRGSREATGLSSGEGLIAQVADAPPKAEGAKGKREPDTPRPQGVIDKRLIVVEPEFASVLRNAKRDGNILSAIIRSAWDSGNLDTLVKNAPVKATNAHISIIGHITQIELQRMLSDVEVFNGFANRFLWVAAKRSQLLPDGGAALDLTTFQTRLAECIDFATAVGRLTRDDEAAVRWRELYQILGRPQPGLFGSVTARSEAQVLRLSMIYALLDKTTVIRREHLEAAYDLWQYCEDSARYIFGNSTGDTIGDTVLAAIRKQPRAMTDLHKALSGHCTASQLRTTLQRLLEQGLIECKKEATKGRPAEIWHAKA